MLLPSTENKVCRISPFPLKSANIKTAAPCRSFALPYIFFSDATIGRKAEIFTPNYSISPSIFTSTSASAA